LASGACSGAAASSAVCLTGRSAKWVIVCVTWRARIVLAVNAAVPIHATNTS
jgi:hypothetical protein